MNLLAFKAFVIKIVLAVCFLSLFNSLVPAQVPMEPERNRLLNGLRVLIWPRSGDQDVLLKLRVHSGAAFDLAGKAGSMALLGDILFPDPTTREYFTEEMQGRLNVATDYDSLTITMQGRAREFERIVEILRTALVTTQITPENVARVREGRIKILKETSISSVMLADRASATRLFGDFPYGRPYGGSVESLDRVCQVVRGERLAHLGEAGHVGKTDGERDRALGGFASHQQSLFSRRSVPRVEPCLPG